ncbi:MAG: hypothetical protein ACTSR2_15180 [Candidatus Hodarchaeales archaeon]
MKVDLSDIPESDLVEDLVKLIKEKENLKVKKDGKTIAVEGLSSRKLKFYTKKILGKAELPGLYRVISQGDHFKVFYKEEKNL